MKTDLLAFAKIIYNLKKNGNGLGISSDVLEKLESVYDGINASSHKMFSATKFIDYFIHDILDYTILNK